MRSDELLRQLRDDEAELLRRLDSCRELIREQEGRGPAGPWIVGDALFDSHGVYGQAVPTCFPTINKMFDGGLWQASVNVFQGRPGIGKTLVATQIALSLAPFCAVGAILADEGMPGSRLRIAQQLGFDRVLMKKNDPDTVQGARDAFKKAAPFWWSLDPTRPEATVEFLAEQLDELAPAGIPRVWLLDSAQRVRSTKRNGRAERRIIVEELLETIHDLALKHRAICILISQVSRGSYRTRDKELQTDPLAAGKEASGIEYMAETIFHLDGNPKEVVKLKCVKNRISAEGEFEIPLKLDFSRATYMELDVTDIEEHERSENEAVLKKIGERIVTYLRKNPRSTSRKIRESVSGSPATIDASRKWLLSKGLIYSEDGDRGSLLWSAPN